MSTNQKDQHANELRSLAMKLTTLASQMDGSYKLVDGELMPYEVASLDVLASLAKNIREERARRNRVFGEDLFGEPAWDMLLNLFEMRVRGLPVMKTALTRLAGVPHSTGVRYIKLLQDRELVAMRDVQGDGRSQTIELTHTGLAMMANCLARQLRWQQAKVSKLDDLAARRAMFQEKTSTA